jgi:hypothetical protein
MNIVQIKAECNQPLEMAAAFGVRLLGAALVFNFDYAALTGEKAHRVLRLRNL